MIVDFKIYMYIFVFRVFFFFIYSMYTTEYYGFCVDLDNYWMNVICHVFSL